MILLDFAIILVIMTLTTTATRMYAESYLKRLLVLNYSLKIIRRQSNLFLALELFLVEAQILFSFLFWSFFFIAGLSKAFPCSVFGIKDLLIFVECKKYNLYYGLCNFKVLVCVLHSWKRELFPCKKKQKCLMELLRNARRSIYNGSYEIG